METFEIDAGDITRAVVLVNAEDEEPVGGFFVAHDGITVLAEMRDAAVLSRADVPSAHAHLLERHGALGKGCQGGQHGEEEKDSLHRFESC